MTEDATREYPCQGHTDDGKVCGDNLYPEILAAYRSTSTPNLNIIAPGKIAYTITTPSDAQQTVYFQTGSRYLLLAESSLSTEPRRHQLVVECTNCKTIWTVTYHVRGDNKSAAHD